MKSQTRMHPAFRSPLPILALTVLSGWSSGQSVARMARHSGDVRHAGTFHVATGEWTRHDSNYGFLGQGALFRNDTASGYIGLLDEGEIAHDEARFPGAGQPLVAGGSTFGTADSYDIMGFEFGYCHLSTTSLEYSLSFLQSYGPCTSPTGLEPIASFVVTGLPVNGCWVFSIDLSGTNSVFNIAAEGADCTWSNDNASDNAGYFFNLNGGQGNGLGQTTTGPLLAGNLNNPSSIGDGTIFQNPGSSGTGLGTEDLFWLSSPTIADGCYFYGGCLPCTSFHTVFFGEPSDLSGVTSYCGANPNSVSSSGAVLGYGGGFGGVNACFSVRDIPNDPGILFAGPDQLQLPFGCGERCVGGQIARLSLNIPMNNTTSSVVDMTVLGGLNNVQYWYRDPDNSANCGATFNLSNALTNL